MTERRWLWVMIGVYAAVFGLMTGLRHYNFETQTWDLAAFVQSFWNASEGRGLVNNLEQVHNHLGLHFSPGLYLLMPAYAVFPSPYFLLFAQTLALALGAWPLFLLAKRIWPKGSWPLTLAGLYLLYPGLHWSNFYDFHEITLFVPLMLAALYFLDIRRWGWMIFFLMLAASMKEDAILAVMFVGLYLIIKKHWKIGLPIAVVSLVYFLIALKVFMPALGGGALRLDRYEHLGATPTEVVKNIATNPLLLGRTVLTSPKASYLFWTFLPVGFLPLASWPTLALLLPGIPENLLTNYHFQFSGMYHYDSVLIPAIFVGLIFGLKKVLSKWSNKEKIIRWTLISLALVSFLARSPLGLTSFPAHYFSDTPQKEAYRNLVRLTPPGVSVAANTNLVPHLSHRENVHALNSEPAPADFVIIDATDPFGFSDQAAFQAYVDSYLKTGRYKAQTFEDRYILIMKEGLSLVPETQ